MPDYAAHENSTCLIDVWRQLYTIDRFKCFRDTGIECNTAEAGKDPGVR